MRRECKAKNEGQNEKEEAADCELVSMRMRWQKERGKVRRWARKERAKTSRLNWKEHHGVDGGEEHTVRMHHSPAAMMENGEVWLQADSSCRSPRHGSQCGFVLAHHIVFK